MRPGLAMVGFFLFQINLVLATLLGMWILSSPTRDRTQAPALEVQNLATRPPEKSGQGLCLGMLVCVSVSL